MPVAEHTRRNSGASWLLALVLVVSLTGLTAALLAGQRPAPAIAIINGHEITQQQFESEVQLAAVRNALRNREADVNKPALLNRMISDSLLLQGAAEAGVTVDDATVQSEVDAILLRLDLSRPEMGQVLADHRLPWSAFERSVREYLILSHFLDEVLFAEVAPAERQGHLRTWLRERYDSAEMTFDQEFLDALNSSGTVDDAPSR